MNKHIYTEEQLDAMSDFELNKAVAEKLGYPIADTNGSGVIVFNGVKQVIFNPLEKYNDCMPIAVKYKFTLHMWADYYFAGYNAIAIDTYEVEVTQTSIQRAIVYCYLMMRVD